MAKQKILNPGWKWYWKLWKKFEPPYIPSSSEIKFWEGALKKAVKQVAKGEESRALVLGVTPEIRDLLAKYKIETTLVDMNSEMHRAMNKLTNFKNPKEKFIKANWLRMEKVLPQNYFDVVLEDSSHNNLQFCEYNKFFRNIYLVLKEKGVFCLGSAVVPSGEKGISYKTLIKVYKTTPKKFKEFKWQMYYLHKAGISDKDVFNQKNLEFKKHIFDKKLEEFLRKGEITKRDLKYLQFGLGKYTLTLPSPLAFHKILRRHFKILKIFIPPVPENNPLAEYKRAYILTKR